MIKLVKLEETEDISNITLAVLENLKTLDKDLKKEETNMHVASLEITLSIGDKKTHLFCISSPE